jgi:acyl-CoA thioesterase FadM
MLTATPQLVAVVGDDDIAAQWCARFLARGSGVTFVDLSSGDLTSTISSAFDSVRRLGAFPKASMSNLCRITSLDELVPVEIGVISMRDGEAQTIERVARHAPKMKIFAQRVLDPRHTRTTGIAPLHLVSLVSVEGNDADVANVVLRDLGMHPVMGLPEAVDDEQFGSGLVSLGNGTDESVLALLRALRSTNTGAGRLVAEWEARTLGESSKRWQRGDVVPAPLELYRTTVNPDWVDYNRHMTEAAYLTAFGWATDALFRYIGDDESYRAAGHSFYTVETHINYEREVAVNEPLRFTTHVLDVDAKRMHFFHEMFHGETGARLATTEQMLVHVEMAEGRSAPILPEVAEALAAVLESHRQLPTPPEVGSVMKIKRK